MFGRWWAPNNPLSISYSADHTAEWKPYLFEEDIADRPQTFESYDDRMYVVVRKGYEHPEIVGKYVSAIFDHARYEDDLYANEVNEYFSINVDPTARPMEYQCRLYRRPLPVRGESSEGAERRNQCDGALRVGKILL